MPWFGIDIGGTLVKLAYFDPDVNDDSSESVSANIRRYLKSTRYYGSTGVRDEHLELRGVVLNGHRGTLHFIRFPTSQMPVFLELVKSKNLKSVADTICATGGGAYKFDEDCKSELQMTTCKFDELDCLIKGIHFVYRQRPHSECYVWNQSDLKCSEKIPVDFSDPYPYLCVNVGSGVSMLAVYSPDNYVRVNGTSLGGSTFLGLCCLLTGCRTYEEVHYKTVSSFEKYCAANLKCIYRMHCNIPIKSLELQRLRCFS